MPHTNSLQINYSLAWSACRCVRARYLPKEHSDNPIALHCRRWTGRVKWHITTMILGNICILLLQATNTLLTISIIDSVLFRLVAMNTCSSSASSCGLFSDVASTEHCSLCGRCCSFHSRRLSCLLTTMLRSPYSRRGEYYKAHTIQLGLINESCTNVCSGIQQVPLNGRTGRMPISAPHSVSLSR